MDLPTQPVTARPIASSWRCQQSGDCCTRPQSVVMTTLEAAAILEATAHRDVPLSFQKMAGSFVALAAQPCPLYDAVAHTCTVYDVRPYNCRRFACMRPNPAVEPWEQDETGACVNREDRLSRSRIVRRQLRLIQQKAQPWARTHGWRGDDAA